ncbi:MAG: WYL domain-containing protein [Anaerolineales bacterium]|nr:WYL domain-containing protein [Chloroflexota bacterium]MBL6981831.1 WYL domain-containing protein [Anaerolineales bacterium]
MRADRLLSLLMILQARGGYVKAEALAEELEVSVRTIYRDVTALSTAGVPVYSERGPGGGIALVERYRTDLTGLNTDEARALFMLSIPAPLDELGFGDELKAAMYKLAAALPSARRDEEESSRQRIHLDWVPWFHEREAQPFLQIIQQAVWENKLLELKYLTEAGEWLGALHATVAPYGLVAKAGAWYLVCERDGHMAVIRISWVQEARILEEIFQHPGEFDLAAFWSGWRANYETNRQQYLVTARVAPILADNLQFPFGENVQGTIDQTQPPDAKGWSLMTLSFESFENARAKLLALGGAVEVLEPLALRLSLADFGKQVVGIYD